MRTSALLVAFLVSACGTAPPPEQLLPLEGSPSFTLYVTNQSFAIDLVDIEVRIDGKLAVRGSFDVEGQHSYHDFEFSLVPGPHTLVATSRNGGASLTQSFTVDGERWAVLSYWYYPSSHYEPTPRSFSMSVFDEPVTFE